MDSFLDSEKVLQVYFKLNNKQIPPIPLQIDLDIIWNV